ncbi:alpha/beta fold hydrolase [Janibacter melonis]|uniref:alpha/beta hydrolase n=1 Tax=Janibacter melonis TaxID=262209 RepID=UPI0017843D4A
MTTSYGQVRLQICGEGPAVVVLVGPTRAASWMAADLARRLPDRQVVAVEMPGVGGSSRLRARDCSEASSAVTQAVSWLRSSGGSTRLDVIATDLAVALAPPVVEALRPETLVLLDTQDALNWVECGLEPPAGNPVTDGGHLLALWTFLRDRRLIRADDPTRPRTQGAALPCTAELADGFIAAASSPMGFSRWWRATAAALPAAVGEVEMMARSATVGHLDEIPEVLDVTTSGPTSSRGPTATSPDHSEGVWFEYVETRRGRAHVRRSGSTGRPVLVLSTGGGSSEQFAPVVRGLADSPHGPRTVASMDYFGNGLSEPGRPRPSVAELAQDAWAVVDALGWGEVDLWGSHTGACVAIEMMLSAPERVGRAVLEAPPMVTQAMSIELAERYFPDLAPTRSGSHIVAAWSWRRDAFLYWPWYSVAHDSARGIGLPEPDELELYSRGILESGETYDGAYRAAFDYDTRNRLPMLTRPSIITAGPHDMLANTLADAAQLIPDGLVEIVPTPETVWWPGPDERAAETTMRIYQDFLR